VIWYTRHGTITNEHRRQEIRLQRPNILFKHLLLHTIKENKISNFSNLNEGNSTTKKRVKKEARNEISHGERWSGRLRRIKVGKRKGGQRLDTTTNAKEMKSIDSPKK